MLFVHLVLFAIFLILLLIVVVKNAWCSNYWKNKNVDYVITSPVFGDLKDFILRRKNLGYLVLEWYRRFPNKKYYGTYLFSIESLIIKDIDLIKKITIKDFEYFCDHINVTDIEQEPIFGKNLTALKGKKWKEMRNFLTPSFTGNKIRLMSGLISNCAKQLNEHLLENYKNNEILEIEAKNLMSRVTIDVISTIAFGIESNSLKQDTILYKIASSTTNPSKFIFIFALIQISFPKLAKILQLSQLPSKETQIFTEIIKETLKKREKHNIIRPDMIQLLNEARKDEKITVNDIIAQGFVFFLAGFEPISTLLSHLLNELALNQNVQRKLQEKLDELNDLSYDSISKIKYLDQIVSETLRLWPPSAFTNRECVKNYLINDDLTIEKGTGIIIPIFGIHRDEKFYPNPDKFDPERFNGPNLNPYAFIPFGIGPRNCIGSRLALLEAKVIVSHLLLKFDVVKVKRTENEVVLSRNRAALVPDSFWLGLKKRKSN
ncbi:cytochrome P450 9e2-like [Onthophagus taurus]|uniref:cytochrome P450 9e2-like n=1 Tax=Onthophagus taurus TaxID=166361 RepID=UPI0039BE4FB3